MGDIKIFKLFTLENGELLKSGDFAYNKNKREQVESPHQVEGFFKTGPDHFAVLKAPNSENYIGEPTVELEKYSNYNSKFVKATNSPITVEHEGKKITISIKDVE